MMFDALRQWYEYEYEYEDGMATFGLSRLDWARLVVGGGGGGSMARREGGIEKDQVTASSPT